MGETDIADAHAVQQHAHGNAALSGPRSGPWRIPAPPHRRGKYRTLMRDAIVRPAGSPPAWRDRPCRRPPESRMRLPPVRGARVTRAPTSARVAIWWPAAFGVTASRPPCLRFMQPVQLQRAARHPVDAEHVIKQRAQDGRQPDRADPAQSAAHVAFLQQHVGGDQARPAAHRRRPRWPGPAAKNRYPDGKHVMPWPVSWDYSARDSKSALKTTPPSPNFRP